MKNRIGPQTYTVLAAQLLNMILPSRGKEVITSSQQPTQWLTPSTPAACTQEEVHPPVIPFDTQRQHELFHSLFKVLFSFRSHYLFAIGIATIFNLRRSTPASLHSTLKLCDLWNKEGKRQGNGGHERDDSPLWWNFSERLFHRAQTYQPSPCTTIPRNPILSFVDSRGGLSFTRVTRCYHGYDSCCMFLPLLICLSSGRASALQRWLN
jgi:hypothetical protein